MMNLSESQIQKWAREQMNVAHLELAAEKALPVREGHTLSSLDDSSKDDVIPLIDVIARALMHARRKPIDDLEAVMTDPDLVSTDDAIWRFIHASRESNPSGTPPATPHKTPVYWVHKQALHTQRPNDTHGLPLEDYIPLLDHANLAPLVDALTIIQRGTIQDAVTWLRQHHEPIPADNAPRALLHQQMIQHVLTLFTR